ncbi:MAG: M48 family metallopeptidase [Alphaproteobacteria bacterium]|nr:M48 family metallopeptidase [Alphaproteobacteria bacterium]
MSAFDTGAYAAGYADGRTARRVDVIAMVAPGQLELRHPDGTMLERWAFADIRLVAAPREGEAGMLQGGEGGRARLRFTQPALLARLREAGAAVPHAHYGDRRIARRALFWGAATVAGVAALFLVVIPLLAKQIAAVIPRGFEARLGDRYVEMLTGFLADGPGPARLCGRPEGRAALQDLVDRLQAHARVDPPPVVSVINGGLVNAFALPGSRLIVLRGLIDAVGDADELAAVIAHELAHVVHRHPTEAAVKRTAGSFVVGLILGDAIGVSIAGTIAGQLLSAAYTREAEAEADDTGLRLLAAAGIDASGFARFMARMAEQEGKGAGSGVLAHFSTHPPSEARAALARGQAGRGASAMSGEAWRRLRAICAVTP